MKIVVLGAGGLLGRHLIEELRRPSSREVGIEVRGLPRAECNIADAIEVRARTAGADVIVNCAAFTNVDGAEKDEDGAYRANALGAENVARAATAHRARLVHISTDFVFDGAQPEPYDEFARPNPQSVYARSKWAGEELAQKRCAELFVVRVQGLYGDGGANFSSKLRQLVLDGKTLKLDGERRVQPTWARSAARQIALLLATDSYGLYHVSCKGETTWAGFTRRLAEKLAAPTKWTVVRSDELLAPAQRPPNCVFQHRMLALHDLDCMPTWEEAQDEYLVEQGSTR
ncbi:MAG: dTDP-4-dehydrorhamnose reductase [Myxococcales bacterium]|nr:dTDP-4-dehydrorhamnose reductase [Myxococcales bacterium]